ncbi:MAG TPA: PadR family transcriptional regulator [Clostridia bacterium]|nr:MAG: Transcriptional regulator PadR-like family protein [Firmicutes bacterium ADurb.Bin248]HOG02138.1 PadR family transcriptional regulator [Clostridia bacterium]HOS19160.1 PadR family transcriptional regulator [Clostridia bacterium]HPK15574.1 PadR family transcriptional regulator [Clostridia bacterium]
MLDPQMKRGLLETCILSALSRGDSYGYQIIKDLSGCIEISESTLYPILRRLEAAGCLTVYSVEHNSRLRKFYHITLAGRRQIAEFLESWNEIAAMYEFIKEGVSHDKA